MWQNASSSDVGASWDVLTGQKSPDGREQSVLAGHKKGNAVQQPCDHLESPQPLLQDWWLQMDTSEGADILRKRIF